MRLIVGSGNEGRRRPVAWYQFTLVAAAACVIVLAARGGWAQSCLDCDQCMTNCVCQADGSCGGGVPKPNGTTCDDGNDCTTIDSCQGGTCVGGSPKNDGDPCTIPGLGLCATSAQCQVISGYGVFCVPQNFVECTDKCQLCNPNTGQCTIPLPCNEDPCSTGVCDPSTGECIPGNEGATCDDGNVCTSNSQCQNGECVGTAGGTPQPTATPTPTATAGGGTSPTPASVACVGDCDGGGSVTVNEIITLVNIALGYQGVVCLNGVPEGAQVNVALIIQAVNNALDGCPQVTPTTAPTSPPATATGTARSTATETPKSVSPSPTTPAGVTPTGGATPSIGTRAAGTIESATSALLVIPNLIGAITGRLPGAGSGGASIVIPPVPFTCSSGGGTVSCNQTSLFPPSPPTYTVTFNSCQVSGTSGTLTIDGTVMVADQAGEVCFSAAPTVATVTAQDLTIQAPNGTTASFSGFSATVALSCSGSSCSCVADTVFMVPAGTITVVSGSTTTQVSFGDSSSISISVSTSNAQCVPTVYDMVVNGDITLTTNGNTFTATYTAYTIHDDATSGHDMVEVNGDVYSACFGDTVSFSTPIDIALGSPCPTAGVVDADAQTSGNTDIITYSNSGVHIDFGAGGSADFQTCLDPRLFACPAG